MNINLRNWRANICGGQRVGNKNTFGSLGDSKLNDQIEDVLIYQVDNNLIKGYEKEKTLFLKVNGHQICTYRMDFVVTNLDNSTTLIEGKGEIFINQRFKFKWNLLNAIREDMYPEGSEMLMIK